MRMRAQCYMFLEDSFRDDKYWLCNNHKRIEMKKKTVSEVLFVLLLMGALLLVGLLQGAGPLSEVYTYSLQVGQYDGYNVHGPWTGLMRENGTSIGPWDTPSVFGWPDHVEADFLWFTWGWMQWEYPLSIPTGSKIESIKYTVEISSEHSHYVTVWPSDLTVIINSVEIHTWVIPGDPGYESYGNNRFGLQENHLEVWNSQYGWLCTWTVDDTGTYFEYQFTEGDMARAKVSDIEVEDLNLVPGDAVIIELSIPYDDPNPHGGINIYGDTWGDYDFDPTISVVYVPLIEATIDIAPDTLHLMSQGRWITCYIELPEGYDVSDIDVSTVLLNDSIPVSLLDVPAPDPVPTTIGDYDDDGTPDLMVKFDRAMVLAFILSQRNTSGVVTLTITGNVNGTPFEGTGTVRVLMGGGGTGRRK